MYIDTHTHLNFNIYKDDADEVIRRSLSFDTWMVIAGTDYKTSNKALQLANKYERGVYATVGLHPTHLEEYRSEDEVIMAEEFNFDMYEKLARFEKVVAIGEIGLDYYNIKNKGDFERIKSKQRNVLKEQLKLSLLLGKPAIIHCREAHDDLIPLLEKFKRINADFIPKDRPWAVIHCFSGTEDLAWKYFSLGLIISFTGLITFSTQWDPLIRKMPSNKFMLETDCPFMAPEPFRGKRNEPIHVKKVAERISQLRSSSLERIAEVSTNNARKFFQI